MMDSEKAYAANAPHVAHEEIEGEVVIINFDNGNYYGMQGAASRFWEAVLSGEKLAAILDRLSATYAIDRPQLQKSLSEFVDQLISEELIVECSPKSSAEIATNGEKLTFEPPLLEKYSDMQDLLLLDPIHEVDEAGWPKEKPAEAPNA